MHGHLFAYLSALRRDPSIFFSLPTDTFLGQVY